MSKDRKVTVSSGNVYADLGFTNQEEELLKAKLVREIRGIIKHRKLTQTKAADVLGSSSPMFLRSSLDGLANFRLIAWYDAWISWTTGWMSSCAKNHAAPPRVPSQHR